MNFYLIPALIAQANSYNFPCQEVVCMPLFKSKEEKLKKRNEKATIKAEKKKARIEKATKE